MTDIPNGQVERCQAFHEVDYYGVSCQLIKGHDGPHAYFWSGDDS